MLCSLRRSQFDCFSARFFAVPRTSALRLVSTFGSLLLVRLLRTFDSSLFYFRFEL